MSEVQPAVLNSHASSTGQVMSGTEWLDVHFEACRPEYEAMVRSAGFQPGWRILDAGCGGGGFLPLLAELVGATGALVALDLAEDNIAAVLDRAAALDLPCPLETRVGDVAALPFPEGHFDAVWCANTSQYLNDDEQATMLAEFRRVVRPGGLVALKEFDGTVPRFVPAPPAAFAHLFEEVAINGNIQAANCMQAPTLGGRLRRAGLTDVWLHTTLTERSAPLGRYERQLWTDYFAFWSSHARSLALPAADQALWEQLADPAEQERLLDNPDFYCCEGHVLAVGRVPGEDCIS